MIEKTDSMMGGGGGHSPPLPRDAGLVLLYATATADLPSAFPLAETTVIGREPPANGILLRQSSVSRMHARIAHRDGEWTITDLDSRNGVIVEGRFVREGRLRSNDVVRIGDVLFKFVADGLAFYAPFRFDDPSREADVVGLVGGRSMADLLVLLRKIAPTELSVLIVGETGTGKGVVAQALHAVSGRDGPLEIVNCAALPAARVEAEIGGRAAALTDGTLVLDAVDDLPFDAQAPLLRVLDHAHTRARARLVATTHRDLASLVAAGAFRADLFARLNGYTIPLPALRDRKEDLHRLVRHFLAVYGHPRTTISFEAMVSLCHHGWPFNVRELAAAVRAALALAESGQLEAAHFPEPIRVAMESYGVRPHAEAPRPADTSVVPSADALREALTEHHGNVAAVARVFAKDRTQIHRWMRMHGIKPGSFR
jgi:DNA-binding NtrC family response regulator